MSASARTRALSDLRADVVFLADLPPPTTTTHITTQNLTDLINAGIAELFNIVVRETNGEVYRQTTTISTANGTSSYNLPAELFRLLLVELAIDSNNKVPVERMSFEEHAYFSSSAPGWYGLPFKYWLTGKTALSTTNAGTIEFLPIPQAIYTITITYVYAPTRLANDIDTLDGFAGFEDYAVLYAATRCLMRKGFHDEAASHRLEMLRVGENIVQMMKGRDAYKPARTQMTREEPRANWRYRRWIR